MKINIYNLEKILIIELKGLSNPFFKFNNLKGGTSMLKYLLIIIIVILLIYLLIVYSLFKQTFLRDDNIKITEDFHLLGINNMNTMSYQKHYITSFDNLKLSARYYKVEEPKRIVLAVHGYKGFGIKDMGVYSTFFMKENSNYFVIDHRAHNDSEGTYITMGSKEKYDLKQWIEYINTINPINLPIYILSVSMGSATSLQCIGLELPSNVKGLIADSGYTSTEDIIKRTLKSKFSVQGNLTCRIANLFCKLIGKFSIYDSNTINYLNKTTIPVLFIHGLSDDFVPPYMSQENFDQCNSEKEIHYVNKAKHCMSYIVEKDNYEYWVKKFIEKTK